MQNFKIPLIVDTFSRQETSSASSADGEHVSCNFHILHALITSYPEVQAQILKCVAICP